MGNITQDGSAFGEMATDKTIRRTLRLGVGFGLGLGSDGDTSLVALPPQRTTGFGTRGPPAQADILCPHHVAVAKNRGKGRCDYADFANQYVKAGCSYSTYSSI